MSKTALIITHAAALYDKSMSIKDNVEDFLRFNSNIDIIRLKSPEYDDYIDAGEVIESDIGFLDDNNANKIVSSYDRIITAGGYFNFCALRTYNSLLSAYFKDNKTPLEIVVPLSLFYVPETDFRKCEIYLKKSYTVEEVIKACEGAYKGRINWHLRQRNLQLNRRAQHASKSYDYPFSYCVPGKEFIARNNGLNLVGLMSHRQLESK